MIINASDQRIQSGFPENPDFILQYVTSERPEMLSHLSASEGQQLIPLSLGLLARDVHTNPNVSPTSINRLRTDARQRVGAITLEQLVYLGLNGGQIPYQTIDTALCRLPSPEESQVLSLAALGFDVPSSARVLMQLDPKVTNEVISNRRSSLSEGWAVVGIRPAIRRAFELGVWTPHPVDSGLTS